MRAGADTQGLDSAVLLKNALWFARIRWFIIFLFVLTGILGMLIPDAIQDLGFAPPHTWPWVLAGILITVNVISLLRVKRLDENSSRDSIEISMWLQIVVDLIVLTFLVHIVGSTQTGIAFTYLFHIVLACIFFPPRRSLLVTLMAAVLYLACVMLEMRGWWPSATIFLQAEDAQRQARVVVGTNALTAVVVWIVLWHLVSALSRFVRERDTQLNLLNRELLRADQAKNRLMLQTTHDLKAPFSGIENNIQMLRLQHWDEMTEPVRQIVQRIEVRSETLRERIRDILLLGELRSHAGILATRGPFDLQPVLSAVVDELSEKAAQRRVTVKLEVPSMVVVSNDKQLRILLLNLLANAIIYSYEDGEVAVIAQRQPDAIVVSVRDHGIGIKADALPHIFDEYYRTGEAADFNKLSTGLGLAIVRQIARGLNLTVRVTSAERQGTTVEVIVPTKHTIVIGG